MISVFQSNRRLSNKSRRRVTVADKMLAAIEVHLQNQLIVTLGQILYGLMAEPCLSDQCSCYDTG